MALGRDPDVRLCDGLKDQVAETTSASNPAHFLAVMASTQGVTKDCALIRSGSACGSTRIVYR
jgi:hypothetical protein